MLRLNQITKTYPSGNVTALKSVSLSFRKNEFVSILGPSGCGKTTLLNIIGGLDRYTSGELLVRHIPTAQFSDRDWDTYRNHSIGFVFQSYNLIPHQTVLANVELALTLSGVSASERKRRAEEALRAVGLGDQLKKKPSQMSGGQMQRVAIARALVNDPDILLADEPTGALDSETSVGVMEILREVSKTKLVIMVTHNPELAEQYSTRIIRFLDGVITSDSDPYSEEDEESETYNSPAEKTADGKKKRTSMSFLTALGLSLNNLMTKKARTILTAFAGSIGIIGIAAILALSHGINLYIDKVQEDTLSAYPVQIEAQTVDMSSLMASMMTVGEMDEEELSRREEEEKIYSNVMMFKLINTMSTAEVKKNNLTDFIKYIESTGGDFNGAASAISYGYNVPINIYSLTAEKENGMPEKLNPSEMFMGLSSLPAQAGSGTGSVVSSSMMSSNLGVWQEMIDNEELMRRQYDLVSGEYPDSWDEVVLVLDANNEINDVYLYALGMKDSKELEEMMKAVVKGTDFVSESTEYSYSDFIGLEFALIPSALMYEKTADGSGWEYKGDNPSYMQLKVDSAEKIKIVGIIKPNPEAAATSLSGAVAYLPSLKEHVMEVTEDSEIVKAQRADEKTDVLTGLEFLTEENDPEKLTDEERASAIKSALEKMNAADRASVYTKIASSISDVDAAAQATAQMAQLPPEQSEMILRTAIMAQSGMDEATVIGYIAALDANAKNEMLLGILVQKIKTDYSAKIEKELATSSTADLSDKLTAAVDKMTDSEIAAGLAEYMPTSVSERTLEENLTLLGSADRSSPSSIKIYTDTFEAKDEISNAITEYNKKCSDDGREEDIINYTDYVALMMSSISTIINVISYVLIAFVSISLVVSSIMIGIITYISVLERTKEIGILRAVGASKKDISRVFNAETLIVGFVSGTMGILATILITIPANIIIKSLTDISNLAQLPVSGAVILVLIAMSLTMIAGLIPSHLAAKKDPVEALRES